MALSPAFIAGTAAYFPVADITFDRFSEVKLLNETMDKVCKDARKEYEAKNTFLKNRENLSVKQATSRVEMVQLYSKLGETYRLKVLFNDL